jgi:hypothetical protein
VVSGAGGGDALGGGCSLGCGTAIACGARGVADSPGEGRGCGRGVFSRSGERVFFDGDFSPPALGFAVPFFFPAFGFEPGDGDFDGRADAVGLSSPASSLLSALALAGVLAGRGVWLFFFFRGEGVALGDGEVLPRCADFLGVAEASSVSWP